MRRTDAIILLIFLYGLNVKVYLEGDRLRLEDPYNAVSPELLKSVKKYKKELINILSGYGFKVKTKEGAGFNIYPARPSCIEAGYCLKTALNRDCNLFPLGWCWGYCTSKPVLILISGGKKAAS